jgi:transcriptional regulator GlxA family with amidase domain
MINASPFSERVTTMGLTAMIYERPIVQRWGTVDGFLALLVRQKLNTPAGDDWRVRKLQMFIESHPGKVRWNLDDVCKELGLAMSGRQARRVFMACIGMGIREYSKKRRLASAAEQLRSTNAPIKAIAADAGYQSTCHFARSFKEVFHLSPLEFRRNWSRKVCAV